VLEISVMMAQFPSKEIAELSYEYRTLGLGYRQYRRPVDDHRHSLRQPRGRASAVR
jgi:ribonucleotide reductase alpha subunit